MEDRKLEAAESLALIGRMIENTRSRMVRNSGRPLLAWGYATVLTTLAVWGAVLYFQDPRWNYLWLMLPLLGWLLMWISREKKPEGEVRTFVDRVIGNVWTVMGLSAWFVSMLALFTPMRLLDNEVDEKYINQILDEIEKFLRPGNSLDVILSNVYQKLILRFGQPETIKVNGKKPRVVFFVGPTGVGKTTTIAKIASKFKVNYNKNIAFITADTYRIAATDQLRTFANILDTPLSVIYTATELNSAVAEYEQADVIFVDTAGFSHKNETQRNDMRALLAGLSPEYEKSVYLVLSATTKYRDLISIIDSYKDIDDYKLIFTKLDETSSYGNLLNIKLYSDAGISYVTNGQNVPDDIEVFDTQKIVKQLLGGRQ